MLPNNAHFASRLRLIVIGLLSVLVFSSALEVRAQSPTPTPPPPQPGLTATAGKARVTLVWSGVIPNTSYKTYKSSSGAAGSFSWLQESNGNQQDNMQVDPFVANGQTYYYFIEACNGGGCAYSGVASATVRLDAPTVSASPGAARIAVTWNAVADADGYQLFRAVNGGSYAWHTNVQTLGPTSVVDHQVGNGANYSYYVLASNGAGKSPASNVASANVNLAAPAGVSAVRVSTSEIRVTWAAVPDATAYAVWSTTNPNGGFFFTHDDDGSSSNTSATIRHISATAVYYFYVTASNSAGNSPPSVVVSTADGDNQPECCYVDSAPMLDAGPGAGSHGPSEGDPVNLATGAESYSPQPDLEVYNPNGLGVTWRRNYHSYQALRGYGSPGFSAGWSHPYDVTLRPANAGSWGLLNLNYANGAGEPLTPELGSAGQPTGVLLTRPGAPYFARGVPGSNVGEWVSVTITWKDQSEWRFNPHPSGLYPLAGITDRLGGGVALTWNGDRTLAQIADAASGATLLTLSYGAGGRLASVADAYGRQVVYGYSAPFGTAPGRLESVSQVGGAGATPPARWTYTYDSANGQQLRTIRVPSPTGTGLSTATINYDNRGRVSSLVDANGNQRVITYGAGSTQVQVKNASGATVMSWTQTYSASRRDTGIVDANNKSTLREYNDPANPLRPTRVVGRDGKATSYTYDQFGNVLTVTTPRNVTTVYAYDYTAFALGRLTSVKEGAKPATTFEYFEPSGLLKSVTSPSPAGTGTATTSYTYDDLGNVLSVTGPGNNAAAQITTTYNYTADGSYAQPAKFGQPLTVTDNLGHVTRLRYDAQGRITSLKDALGQETSISYNLAGQPEELSYPATGQTGTGRARAANAYLYVGGPLNQTTTYDESNVQARQVIYGYGAEGEAASVAGGAEPVTYTYDALYRLKTLKDGENNTTTYDYDGVGNLSGVQMPGGETVQFPLHDPAGRVLRRIDGNGVTTNYVYDDPENLLTDIQYPATPALNVHFGYDSFGRRNLMTDATGSHGYVYGDLDELKSVTTAYTGVTPYAVSYAYYPDGSRKQMTTPAGGFTYGYDAAGRPSSVTNPFYETTQWAYFDNDRLRTQQLEVGALTTYEYNARGQLTRLLNELDTAVISDFNNFAYDGAGNRKSYTASVPGYASATGMLTYEYDAKSQLKREQSTRGAGLDHSFVYDGVGNPTTFRGAAQNFNANNQQQGAGFSHDDNGAPTLYKGQALAFDPENRLTAYGSAMTAGYRGDGLRAWKENAQGRVYFVYDGSLPVLEVTPAPAGGGESGGELGGELGGGSDAGSVTVNTFGAAGLISRKTQGGLGPQGGVPSAFYTFDPQGSVSRVVSPAYSPVGVWPPPPPTVSAPAAYTAHGAPLAGAPAPFGYKAQWGYYTDAETGLQLLTHRYYDPQAGRFLTRDPVGYEGGVNLYGYVQNDPTNGIDPFGLDKLTLPNNPSGLPPGWTKDPSHQYPGGERWISPSGQEGLDFHHGKPGQPKWGGRDHWHKVKPGRNGKWGTDGTVGDRGHLAPGDVVDVDRCITPAPRRLPGRTAEEWRLIEESNRQMEKFWQKIAIGAPVGGAVLLGGPTAAGAVWRLLTGPGGRLIPAMQ